MSKVPQNIVMKETKDFETFTVEKTSLELNTNVETGLSEEEAKIRLEKYGPNKLEEKKKKTWIKIFFEQLNNPMIFVLFGAILVTLIVSIYETIHLSSLVNDPTNQELLDFLINNGYTSVNQINWFLDVGDWPDVLIILAVVFINSIIGTVQEVKAQTSLDVLKNLSSPESTVIRDGKRFKVKSTELVVGDVVILEEGDTIGADLRLIEAVNLKTNESSLTGESLPVEKDASLTFSSKVVAGDRINCAYMSTPVSYGRGKGIVINTGMDTEIGKIASALDEGDEGQTPLQKALGKLSKFLGLLTILVVVFVLVVSIIWLFVNRQNTELSAWIDTILSSIALAVAAIPEGLTAVVTIVLSIGVQRMVKVNTVVRKLPSVETLGAVSVVCSDKTGTLTQNKMTVVEAYTNDTYYKSEDFNESNNNPHLRELATGMSLCSNATVDEGLYGDPTEIALVVFANEFNLHKKDIETKYPRVDELPFDSVRKMMSTKHTFNGESITFTKGALDSILKHAKYIKVNGEVRDITNEDIETIYKANKYFSDKALRVLALAYNNKTELLEEELVFVGLVAMIDPPRIEAKPAVSKFKDAGIITVMITGDHKDTAFAIAKELGICDSIEQCMMGLELDDLTEEELQEKVKTIRVFARVSPENKTAIVKAFQANGNICAMTGDGVNDAPSLKAADIGIAMGITGTDVAKGAADMVLTDDNFASIQKAVEEGRSIYANIKKTVIFLLSSNIAEVLTMFIIICLGFPQPLIAIHLLWVNLVTDSLPAIALGMDSKDPNAMKEKPRNPNEGLFANGGFKNTIIYGVVITLSVLIAYFSAGFIHGAFTYSELMQYYSNPQNLAHAQTMAFTCLALAELFHMLGMANPNRSFIHVFKGKNFMMLIAFIVGFILQLIVINTPVVTDIFKTTFLELNEWLIVGVVSLIPLITHEIIVFIKWLRNQTNK